MFSSPVLSVVFPETPTRDCLPESDVEPPRSFDSFDQTGERSEGRMSTPSEFQPRVKCRWRHPRAALRHLTGLQPSDKARQGAAAIRGVVNYVGLPPWLGSRSRPSWSRALSNPPRARRDVLSIPSLSLPTGPVIAEPPPSVGVNSRRVRQRLRVQESSLLADLSPIVHILDYKRRVLRRSPNSLERNRLVRLSFGPIEHDLKRFQVAFHRLLKQRLDDDPGNRPRSRKGSSGAVRHAPPKRSP